jgi:hypothetical protein
MRIGGAPEAQTNFNQLLPSTPQNLLRISFFLFKFFLFRKLMEKYHDYSIRMRNNTLSSLTNRLR